MRPVRSSYGLGWALVALFGVGLGIASPAAAQLDTISQFYIPGQFCMWDPDGPGGGAWRCSGPAPQAQAEDDRPDVWGAIAISPDLGYGYAWNMDSEAAAIAAAIKACTDRNSGGCKAVVVVPDICVALAISAPQKIYVASPSGAVNFAEDMVRYKCEKAGGKACEVKVSFCADGIRHIAQDKPLAGSGGTRR